MLRLAPLISLILIVPVLFACGANQTSSSSDGRPNVVATIGMLGDLAASIVGESANVTTMIPSGVDPHSYTPRRRDLVLLSQADLILYNGVHLEGRMGDTLSRPNGDTRSIAVAEEVLRRHGLKSQDPHLWMDVALWRTAAEVVRDELIVLLPDSASALQERWRALDADLATLDEKIVSAVATIPKERRVLITAHDAFDWFGNRYGFEVVGVQGVSTLSEPGLADIALLVNRLVQERIPAIFIETSVSDRNIRAVLEGARAQGHDVQIGGELFSDSMGAKGTYTGTYIGMIDHNVTTIVRALGGELPPSGLFGRLPEE